MLGVAFMASCAVQRAQIDGTMSGRIIWPGPPEKPRIKYLWSLERVSGAERGPLGRLAALVAGGSEEGTDPDFLSRPHGLFVSDEDTLYITDTGASRVNVINLRDMRSFGIERAGRTRLISPIAVAADGRKQIFVSDADLRRVAIFSGKGKFIKFFEGDFNRPTGLAVNTERGLVYVADTWDHKVYIHNVNGKRLGSIGGRGDGSGKLNYPTHITVDRDGFLYVSDTLNFRVQIFTPSGGIYGVFGLVGDSYDTFDKIKGIGVDTEGHIYVVDSAMDMVKIFDREGRVLLFFGREGHFYGNFFLPAGIYVDYADRIYVADSLNGRVQAFQFLGGDGE